MRIDAMKNGALQKAVLHLCRRMEDDRNKPDGLCNLLDATQTLTLQLEALAEFYEGSMREVADALRRRNLNVAASNAERLAQCGPWLDGHRWRAEVSHVIRSDVDPSPLKPDTTNCTAERLENMLMDNYACLLHWEPGGTWRRSDRVTVLLDIGMIPEGCKDVRQVEDPLGTVACYKAGEIVALVMPMKKAGGKL